MMIQYIVFQLLLPEKDLMTSIMIYIFLKEYNPVKWSKKKQKKKKNIKCIWIKSKGNVRRKI